MSDSRLGSLQPSPFQRLYTSVKVDIKEDAVSTKPASGPSASPPVNVFKEVAPPADEKNAAVVNSLRSSVDDLKESADTINRLASEEPAEVAGANQEAAQVRITDVRAATKLADDLQRQILDNSELAKRAQPGPTEARLEELTK